MKRRSPIINRRAFLYGAGTTGVALPFLEGLPERSAFAQGETARFGLFICTANGVIQDRFWPSMKGQLTTDGMAADSDSAASVLADHADRLLFVNGVNYPSTSRNCGHAQGLAMCLTGKSSNGGAQATSSGPSLDSIVADAYGVEPLTLYAGPKVGYIDERLSFTGPGQVRGAEGNPFNTYERLAGLVDSASGAPTGMGPELISSSKSVNDLIRADLNSLRSRKELSQADKARLDLHFDTIRDLENGMMDMSLSCSDAGLDLPAIEAIGARGYIEDVAKFQMELTGLAFACNSTRVATLQQGDGTDNTVYRDENGNQLDKFHHISHRVQSDGGSGNPIANAEAKHHYIDRLRLETFKYGLDKWAQFSTPNGPLLDNAFAMWTSAISDGPSHGFDNVPMIIAGSPGGYLKQGQHVELGEGNNADVLRTLMSALGVAPNGFAGSDDEADSMKS